MAKIDTKKLEHILAKSPAFFITYDEYLGYKKGVKETLKLLEELYG